MQVVETVRVSDCAAGVLLAVLGVAASALLLTVLCVAEGVEVSQSVANCTDGPQQRPPVHLAAVAAVVRPHT
eukprot:15450081-Alexandrium_andersonii.AAC.1